MNRKKKKTTQAHIPVSIEVFAHTLDWLSRLDCSTAKRVPIPRRAVY